MMEVGNRMDRLQRRPSIETEPMTLHLDQIENAREEAMFVLKTKTFEEAMDIFMKETEEGLRSKEKRGGGLEMKDDEDDEDDRLIFVSPHGWDIATAPF